MFVNHPVSEQVITSEGYYVERYTLLGTKSLRRIQYKVGEPTILGAYTHFALFSVNGQHYGDITCRSLPAEIEAISPGPERIVRCRAFYAECAAEAQAIIQRTFPGDFA